MENRQRTMRAENQQQQQQTNNEKIKDRKAKEKGVKWVR